MSEVVDADSQQQVTQLVDKLTDKRKFALDPELARNLKRLCKASDLNIRSAFDALSEQLKASHAQVPPPFLWSAPTTPQLPPPVPHLHSFTDPSQLMHITLS